MPMQIQSLSIMRRSEYSISEAKPEAFEGSIMIKGNTTYTPDIKINLDAEQLVAILNIVAPAIVKVVDDGLSSFRNELQSEAERLAIAGPGTPIIDA